MIRQLMEVSPIRKTLTAPRGIVNGVALDNNSFPALPLPSPALLLQAEQEDESKAGGVRRWRRSGSILQPPQSQLGGY